MSRPGATIGLAMIVRDEAALLPGCLRSVAGAVDELVVVDTGSSDGTVDLVHAVGARVIRFPWVGDFAAARNVALDALQTDWVLSLDADERLAPGAPGALREAVGAGGFELGLLPLHNARGLDDDAAEVLSGRRSMGPPVLLPRLARRTQGLRWAGAVHEGWGAWATRIGARVVAVPADLIHLGAVPGLRSERGKGNRNLDLLLRRVGEEPGDIAVRQHLARELADKGRFAEALEQAERGWTLLCRGLPALRVGASPLAVGLGATLGRLRLQRGDLDGCVALLTELSAGSHRHPDLDHISGTVCLLRACRGRDAVSRHRDLLAAAASFLGALGAASAPTLAEVSQGVCDWRSDEGHAVASLMLGDPGTARRSFLRAAERARDPGLQRVGAAECLLAAGDVAGALAELEPLLTAESPDAALVVALAVEAAGQDADQRVFLSLATRRAAVTPVASHRLARLWGLEVRQALVSLLQRRGLEVPSGAEWLGPPGAATDEVEDALALGRAGRALEGLVRLVVATRRDPWDPNPWEAIARLLLREGQDAGAAAARQVAARIVGEG